MKSRTRIKDQAEAKGARAKAAAATSKTSMFSQAGIRETIESIVVAFVLAFLFRAFEAEAFVIPTGSMAPTLMGRHKDVDCPACGYSYQVSASDEVETETGALNGVERQVKSCTCPLCRYTMNVGPLNPQHQDYPSYSGDRILVGKFPYQFHDPKRWDVAVFKYPEEAQTNFIKRIVGLPGETIKISHGDLFVKPEGRASFTIARKPPEKLLAMLQPVYDDDYVVPLVVRDGWPMRWRAETVPAGWIASEDLRSFETKGQAEDAVWLRYHHIVPSLQDWDRSARGERPLPADQRPQLISDFCAYNTSSPRADAEPIPEAIGLHWVGDLALQCAMEVQGDRGEVVLQLIKGGRRFECRINVSTGKAALAIDGLEGYAPAAQTTLRGPGAYEIMFSNVDDQLRLWVDGKLVRFDAPTTYDPLGNTAPQSADLSPVGIASRGAALRVSRLKILRDIYYIAQKYEGLYAGIGAIADYDARRYLSGASPSQALAALMSEPSRWASIKMGSVEFAMGPDQFFMLGDNSARSKDGRLWSTEHYVRRELLTGQALFIYWPHSWDRIPYVNIPFPYFPNFAGMHVVR